MAPNTRCMPGVKRKSARPMRIPIIRTIVLIMGIYQKILNRGLFIPLLRIRQGRAGPKQDDAPGVHDSRGILKNDSTAIDARHVTNRSA
ncbi:hypothetical protein BCEP4_70024 [Burkholderia cepacia]|nr:hypothetical protein BCEP4_70024 [Burkholderia cepacia]